MIVASLVLFIVAGLMGAVLLRYVTANIPAPKAIVFAHGIMAVTALVLLIVYIVTVSAGPFLSLILFLLAAGGGIIMVTRELSARPVPTAIAVIHAGVALAGVITLVMYIL